MAAASPQRLLLVGGGHAHLAVLSLFARHPREDVEITLVSAEENAFYSGMVPGVVAGHYRADEAQIPLAPLAARAAARFVHGEVTALSLEGRRVILRSGTALPFDILSLDIGSTPSPLPDAGNGVVVPVKPVGPFLAHWEKTLQRAKAGGPLRLAIVGGGLGGIELALAAAYRLKAADISATIDLLTREDTPGAGIDEAARSLLNGALGRHGVRVHTGFAAVRAVEDHVEAADGRRVAADAVWLATDACAAVWPSRAGLAVDARGFVRVDETLRSLSHPSVLAAGDAAAFDARPLPKSGVVAVRQGKRLADNLWAALGGEPLGEYRPQRRWLALVGEGGESAVALRGRWAARGRWAWSLKRAIDTRFVRRHR
jgi:selenide,water dikinase